ncbi:hypothetical protein F2Q69_00022237 [Brassica cretica]|uniref:Uncharacterized protein n=1 Tax=Brassica cretica TaxID=69181 RepID=A0A8S9Q4M1_BRACR|nr:hypothetical protein F2Q69_00022237 [Brassica cretica]
MAKKVNKTFTKSKRVEEVSLAKSGLLDEIKEETSEEGCKSGRSDQGASSLEPGHEVFCGTKGRSKALGVNGEGFMVKNTTHDGSKVLNRSRSKGSSTGASGRDAVENGDVLGQRMHILWGRKTWCGAHLMREKSTFGVEVSRPCGVKVLSWSRVDLESKRVPWRKGKRNKLGYQFYDLKKVE